MATAIDRAIGRLQYGDGIAQYDRVFIRPIFMVTPWGAIPGHDIYDIQSGLGRNFNFLMLDGVEKGGGARPLQANRSAQD